MHKLNLKIIAQNYNGMQPNTVCDAIGAYHEQFSMTLLSSLRKAIWYPSTHHKHLSNIFSRNSPLHISLS